MPNYWVLLRNHALALSNITMLQATIAGMVAENQWREQQGKGIAYNEEAFVKVVDESSAHHNAICTLFNEASG